MRNTLKFSIIIVVTVISITVFIVESIHQSFSDEVVKEKNDLEQAKEFAEEMKPKVEERLHKIDIHNFIKTITFDKGVNVNPMGYIIIRGYINGNSEKYDFSVSLEYRSKEVGTMTFSPELSYRFKDWDKFKDEPQLKENYLKRLSKKEREQYLKDIGDK
ncbi:DUF1433 domain-containing protein [Bacillus altitudinis MN12]|uniref:Uncharacterized protein YxeA n=1 Tax=Bacillus aerius TaxID=293388 RepID=A0ABR6AXQ1_9BACI|nr:MULTISPECIES: hypothetical protein [Bacillus]MBW3701061.1 DUF1433 domain-containing protein [Bacillus aerophilus]MCA1014871.1 DUF1433 domain-containing protein [Bacillus stratosphericus]MBA8916428.1 uncharacterized protein YxeA [Bacillus aerius]MBR0584317.1 DUF1433 domain-containing protein [Bacillus altitudinis MN12]MBR0594886.1 DUF1433 domain-containing protein [Bacillus altitudinis C16B11]